MENLAEWINATSITEELNKVESKSYTNEATERTADHIGSNFLLEDNAEERSEAGRRTTTPIEKGLEYQISMLPEKKSQRNRRLMQISSIIGDKTHSMQNITKVKEKLNQLDGISMMRRSMQIIISLMTLMRSVFNRDNRE